MRCGCRSTACSSPPPRPSAISASPRAPLRKPSQMPSTGSAGPDTSSADERLLLLQSTDLPLSSENIFLTRLNAVAADTEALLDRLLEPAPLDGERDRPNRLLASIRYSSLGGGKRFRPFLVVESAALFG